MSWRVKPDEVFLEVGKLFGSKIGLQKLNYEVSPTLFRKIEDFHEHTFQNFSLAQFGVNSGRGSIISCGSVPATQTVTTIGVFKGERVAIKKISKKKVSRDTLSPIDLNKALFLLRLKSTPRFCGKSRTRETYNARIPFAS
jgi:hypothetical protein